MACKGYHILLKASAGRNRSNAVTPREFNSTTSRDFFPPLRTFRTMLKLL